MADHVNELGNFLRHKRTGIDPADLGLTPVRRRTSGLRREEVAQRAHISAAWYTSLEQGRGGAASESVLDRLAVALLLTDVEREHLFLLGLGHMPKMRYQASDSISPRLQRILDGLVFSPAIVRTATWNVLAWNRAATLVLADYASIPLARRNILRMLFCDPDIRKHQLDWEGSARSVVAAFRIDVARAGADVTPLIEELRATSPEFATLWDEKQLQTADGVVKQMHHPALGLLSFEYSCLAIDSFADLSIIVYTPTTSDSQEAMLSLVNESGPLSWLSDGSGSGRGEQKQTVR